MSDSLSTYIHDHLAGAHGATELLERLRSDHEGEPLAVSAAELLVEITADRRTLEDLARRLSGGYSRPKQTLAWLGARISRAKVGRSISGDFGSFQALEWLVIGIHGKRALWSALAVVSPAEPELGVYDFQHLIARADAQLRTVEEHRLRMALGALGRNVAETMRTRD